MSKDNSGPAFPRQAVLGPDEDSPHRTVWWDEGTPGLTKREWFAGMALQGMVAGCPWGPKDLEDPTIEPMAKQLSDICFKLADAMLTEGNKGETNA